MRSRKKNHIPYNYTKLIDSAMKNGQYTDFHEFVDKKIHEYRESLNANKAREFNRFKLADMIGIDPSTLTKIINGCQATRKRDIIIALCFALHLNKSETDQALNLYLMAPLNPYNMRDLVIIQTLNDDLSFDELNVLDEYNPVERLNDTLKNHGFPQLDILRGDRKEEKRVLYIPLNSTSYKEVSVNIQPYCAAGDDLDLSLNMRYRPDRYDYYNEMIIKKNDKEESLYRISDAYDDQYDIYIKRDDGWKILYSNDPYRQKHEGAMPCDEAELLNEVAKLKEYTDRKARYIHNMCNDTRNYISRFSAHNDHGHLEVYGERFGFDAPELSEYFQLKISNNSCQYTVSHTSRFMEWYLDHEAQVKLYGTLPSSKIKNLQSYKSLDEVADKRWRMQFQKLLQSASDLLEQIRERRLFLFNARAWIDIDKLMRDFRVEEAFECYHADDQPYEIVPKKDHIIGSDGKPITVDDLYRAEELGIFTVEDLCTIRTRYGSLEQFIQIDKLTEQEGIFNE